MTNDKDEIDFSWTSEAEAPSLTVRVCGELDFAVSDRFKSELQQAVSGYSELYLDLGDVTFIDSSGLAVLLSLARTLPPATQLTLTRLSDAVVRLFEVTHVGKILKVKDAPGDPAAGVLSG